MKLINIYNKINEEIYGRYAIMYHRTSTENLIDSIYNHGYKFGGGQSFGAALYGTYDLESQLNRDMIEEYGNVIVKFQVTLDNFFIFDYDEYIKSPIGNLLKSKEKDYEYIYDQLKYYKISFEISKIQNLLEEYFKENHTSKLAYLLSNHIPGFTAKVNGIIFTGKKDGRVIASYKPNKNIIPISYSIDEGKTWKKTDYNMDYFKKIFKGRQELFTNNNKIVKLIGIQRKELYKKYPWLKDTKFYGATIEFKDNILIWKDGTWITGKFKFNIWEDGIWENGTWLGEIWKNGTWQLGFWEGGTWEKGTWEYGEWKGGTWEDGDWYDGFWKGGDWLNGTFNGRTWENGIWHDGTFERGKWLTGTWLGGTWENGIWKNGTWEDGDFKRGKWLGGKWKGGTFGNQAKWLDPNNPKPE